MGTSSVDGHNEFLHVFTAIALLIFLCQDVSEHSFFLFFSPFSYCKKQVTIAEQTLISLPHSTFFIHNTVYLGHLRNQLAFICHPFPHKSLN